MGKRNFTKIKPYLFVAPVAIFVLAITILSMGESLRQSFGIYKQIGLDKFTLKYYKDILSSKEFVDSLVFTFKYSIFSAIISIFLGLLIAFYLKKHDDNFVMSLNQVGIILPHMIVGVMVYQILGQTGLVSRILFDIGLIDSFENFPSLVYDKNGIGVMTGYIFKEMTFVTFTLYSVLIRISDEYRNQAFLLGANKTQTFFKVTLPMILPNIWYSFVIIFTYAFSSYEIPVILGPNYPKTLSEISMNYYTSPVLEDHIYSMVINNILLLVGLIGFVIFCASYNKIITQEASYE
ncbi:MAG: ABC transporter permease subunit [Ezakiella sp.]|nr:ABC transporter permease subunit [Ezakiella sp.]MDD7471653.1 ABC transporter permease subunit [Bacillota bacterium]MDY3923437.1 ABC transporter permease subunit [Ezakiella sp.]